jgi:hypothetical protein
VLNIKMAQMLIVERAVLAAIEGEVEYPSHLHEDMMKHFMVRGTRTPFDWAFRLRAYAKKDSQQHHQYWLHNVVRGCANSDVPRHKFQHGCAAGLRRESIG